MPRLVVSPSAYVTDPVAGFVLEGSAFRHARKVLRLGEGDALCVVDGSGVAFDCRVEEVTSRTLLARIVARHDLPAETGVRVSLYCGLLKGEKLDLVLQKATEVGVAEIVFFEGERCIVHLSGPGGGEPRAAARLERWTRIVDAAVAQCGRATPPRVSGPVPLSQALERASQADLGIMLWEGEHAVRLRDVLASQSEARSVALLVGPEGGFSAAEAEQARACGIITATLGDRVLRAETAAIVGPALVLGLLGSLG